MASKARSITREYVEAALWALVLTMFLRAFVIQAFRIPSESMLDTLLVGDFLFVNKFLYGAKVPFLDVRLPGIRDPKPGDIIVFKYPRDPKKDYIKRCVAVEGQTVEIRDKILFVNDEKQVEPYVIHSDDKVLPKEISARDNFGPTVVPKGHIFMMGDNRDNSHDSRFWGPLALNLIKGKAMILYWSWDAEKNRPRFNRIFRPVR